MGIIRVMIADDHRLFRTGLVAVLKEMKGIKVINEAENGKELLAKLIHERPDVILMDIKMPEMDGIEATENVIAKYPDIKVIMLTMHDDEQFITHMVDLGAHGYLLKNSDVRELELAINHLGNGEAGESWVEGVKLIHRKAYGVLESEGLNRIQAVGVEFDPLQHEAVGVVGAQEQPSGYVVEALRKGYRLRDRVIQPAQVVVAR